MKIRYLGHSGFQIEDLVIDPFIKGNESVKDKIDLSSIKCNIVCVTHDHIDHLGDSFEIAKLNNATVVCIHELSLEAEKNGVKAEGMNIGGIIEIGDWRIRMVESTHSSNLGSPSGFVLTNKKENKTIYHPGDTGLFYGMKLFKNFNIDIALLPIGGRYTMDVKDAVLAAEFIGAKKVIPMHYNTWPIISANPEELKDELSKKGIQTISSKYERLQRY